MRLISVNKMREIENEADKSGFSYAQMMENAGMGLANLINSRFGSFPDKMITGLVGSGNNGGDTLVALSVLQSKGWNTCALFIKDRQEDPLMQRFTRAGGKSIVYEDGKLNTEAKERLSHSTLLLDGVIGTGIRLPLQAELQKFLKDVKKQLNQCLVVAVDCPSGVDCESGEVDDNAIPADLTVCMEAVKDGLMKLPAFRVCGEIVTIPLGLPEKFTKIPEEDWVIDQDWVKNHLPKRSDQGHKKSFGTVTIVGGCTNYIGAPLLAGKAAYRSGSGLVSLAVPQIVQYSLAAGLPEATWFILDDENGVISENAADLVAEQMKTSNCLVVGPGIGREETTQRFLSRWLLNQKINGNEKKLGFLPKENEKKTAKLSFPPIVLDADALRWLADQESWYSNLQLKLVLTPHVGEMSALTGLDTTAIQNNREKIARESAQKWQQVVVLKGALTVIASPQGQIAILPEANSALSKAGSGDALSGIIAALIGEGMQLFDAACAGAWIHARAGRLVSEKQGTEYSLLVTDLIEQIPSVFSEL